MKNKHTYAINDNTLYQLNSDTNGHYWELVHDETGEAKPIISDCEFARNGWVIFTDGFDALTEDSLSTRLFTEEAALTYLVDRDNGGVFGE